MQLTKENIAIIEGDTHISKWVEESGRLDHDQNMLPKVLLHIEKGDTVFDIGAYIGDHTIAYVNKGAIVHAFEPNPRAYECLRYNMEGTGCVYKCIAFSDKKEQYDIEEPNYNFGMTTLKSGGNFSTITLDEYCNDYGVAPDFIKIDAEGMEMKILLGAEKTIAKHKPKMLIEINEGALIQKGTSRKELLAHINNLGYTCHDVYGESLDKLTIQFDIICIPKSKK